MSLGIEVFGVSCAQYRLQAKSRTHLCAWDNDTAYEVLTEAFLLLIEISLQIEKNFE